jgi:glycine/D-amino acid oxidase-like deaminating enzyme
MEQSADYIVAGAGSAGCILARRLANTGASVILLEAGGPDRTRLVRQPGMIAIFHNVPALKKRLDWGYYTAPQASALGRRIPQPRWPGARRIRLDQRHGVRPREPAELRRLGRGAPPRYTTRSVPAGWAPMSAPW